MKHYILLMGVIMFLLSCDRPECTSSNPVFKMHEPSDQAYQRALAQIIDTSGIDAFDYWVAGYDHTPNGNFLRAYIQNSNTCAIIVLEDTGIESLEYMAQVEGRGYRGAGLSGLKYEVKNDGDRVSFVCKSIDAIID